MCCKIVYVVAVYTIVLMLGLCVSGRHLNNFTATNTIYTYVIVARNRNLPDDDVLTSKDVGASYIYFYVII